jgi:hypothetical protein
MVAKALLFSRAFFRLETASMMVMVAEGVVIMNTPFSGLRATSHQIILFDAPVSLLGALPGLLRLPVLPVFAGAGFGGSRSASLRTSTGPAHVASSTGSPSS